MAANRCMVSCQDLKVSSQTRIMFGHEIRLASCSIAFGSSPTRIAGAKTGGPACEWAGCRTRRPIARRRAAARENEYWRFCLDHVREYNHSYNFFAGMSDDAVLEYQKDAITGHRPTWKMGTGKATVRPDFAHSTRRRAIRSDLFGEVRRRAGTARRSSRDARDPQCRAQGARRRSASKRRRHREIKTRFKELVKRHHPDANGGDRSTEDKLREIIQAYNYLKSVGFG